MTNDDKMTIDERRKYLRIMQKRYAQASHQNRSLLLDEMEHVTALDRKTLLRAMRADLERRPRRKEGGASTAPRSMTRCASSPRAWITLPRNG